MPIPASGFSLTTVKNQFGSATYSDDIAPNENLSTMHNHVFGSAGAGAKLSNFASKAQADGFLDETQEASNVTTDSATCYVKAVDFNGVFSGIKSHGWRIIVSTDPLVFPLNPVSSATKTTTGSDSAVVNNLNPSTTYYYKIEVWNAFNYKIGDRKRVGEYGLNGDAYKSFTTLDAQISNLTATQNTGSNTETDTDVGATWTRNGATMYNATLYFGDESGNTHTYGTKTLASGATSVDWIGIDLTSLPFTPSKFQVTVRWNNGSQSDTTAWANLIRLN